MTAFNPKGMLALIKGGFERAVDEKPLLVCLLCAFGLSLPGLNWGVNECWNVDQMGHLKLKNFYMPEHYLKPPLHTYMNHLLVLGPFKQIMGGWFHIPKENQWQALLLGSRLLTLAMFCGFLSSLYYAVRLASSKSAAFVVCLILSTSAGILVFNRYLTADAPLLFWMGMSFAFAIRAALTGSIGNAVAAGLLAGLAGADKYNGLAAAAAIPAMLVVAQGWRFVKTPAPWLAGLAVPVGFVIGNPGCILDNKRFVEDFLYNSITTPVYDGSTLGTGYLKFLLCFPEIIGWPATIALVMLLVAAGVNAIGGGFSRAEWTLAAGAAAVFVLYFGVMGKFPRMGTRFVLPSVPFVLMLAVPVLRQIDWRRVFPSAILSLVLLYNVYSSIDVGFRFVGDPRMKALTWVSTNVPPGAILENSYAPDWRRIAGKKYRVQVMPTATGRASLFAKIFPANQSIRTGVERFETKYHQTTFTAEGLKSRNPDYVAFSEQVFQWSGDNDAQRFYAMLDREELGYSKIFEKRSRPPWPLTYPRHIDFMVDRMLIFQRATANTSK
jgi:hypothetical protein